MPHTQKVFDWFEQNIDIFKKHNIESLLYVGWRHDCKPWWYDYFCSELGVLKVDVLEIFPKNYSDLEQKVWEGRYNVTPILGDITKPSKYLSKKYDLIFWDHGPEHVTFDEFYTTTSFLKSYINKVLLYCAPFGIWPQHIEDNNENEIHLCSLYEENFAHVGMKSFTFGSPGVENLGEIVGIYEKSIVN